MQIPLWKQKPKQVPEVNGTSEAEENAAAGSVLKIRVFLVVENRLLRDVLARLLSRKDNVELSDKSGSAETNPEELAKSGCDVAVLDFLNPEWMSVVREQSQEKRRAVKIILIGMEAESAPFLEAVRCGVTGYLLKDASTADVASALGAVARGEAICPPQMCALLFQSVAQVERKRWANKPRAKHGLTLRQQEFMKLVAKGFTNKEIANKLHLSEFTVKNHMSRILKQLNVENRCDAVHAVRECGYGMSL